jgi:hypothetical protein
MLPSDLEDWLTDEGDRVVKKKANQGPGSLTDSEWLLYEIWLFDTEVRNGGLSQYFGNRGRSQWESLRGATKGWRLPAIDAFMAHVDQGILETNDPESALAAAFPALETLYWQSYNQAVVRELRAAIELSH